jgi:hypothetical protein
MVQERRNVQISKQPLIYLQLKSNIPGYVHGTYNHKQIPDWNSHSY